MEVTQGSDVGRVGGAQPGAARLDLQRLLVQLVVVQQQRSVQEVGGHFRYVIDLVRRLLEVANLAYHVGNLRSEGEKGRSRH